MEPASNEENRKLHLHVRNVLMNEMGLTRDTIRETMKEIVTETCVKFFKSGDFTSHLNGQIDKQLRTYSYGSGVLKKLVAEAVAEAVKKQITDNLKLDIKAELHV